MSKRMTKIKVKDKVIVTAGRDKGKTGEVKQVFVPQKGARQQDMCVVITGVNVKTTHVKPNPNKQQPGGIVKREAPLHISNVAIFNPMTQKADKIGFKILADGQKVRVYRSNGEAISVE